MYNDNSHPRNNHNNNPQYHKRLQTVGPISMGSLNLTVGEDASKYSQSRSLLTFDSSPQNKTSHSPGKQIDLMMHHNNNNYLDKEKKLKTQQRMMSSSSVPINKINTPRNNVQSDDFTQMMMNQQREFREFYPREGGSSPQQQQQQCHQAIVQAHTRLQTNMSSPKMTANEAMQRLNETSAKISEF